VKRSVIALSTALTLVASCGENSSSEGEQVLKSIGAVVVLQRPERMGGVGDVFQYTSYVPGARLLKISPPTADGTRTELCCNAFPEMNGLDIQSYDISFDARSIVFSGRIAGDSHYGLWILTLNEKGEAAGPPRSLGTNPSFDFVYPAFAPMDRIIFVSNENVETGLPQHRDEYERGSVTQLGSITTAGTDRVFGPKNLSHRVAPSMLSDGRVLFTQWDHLGDMNAGHLMMTNPDFTAIREVFGKEGGAGVNSYLKAVEMEPGRLITIGTSRDRTIQSGKILLLDLGKTENGAFRMSEANASARDLTPQVPESDSSSPTVGRYYSAHPVRNLAGAYGDSPLLLVSWADGPVEQGVLAEAGLGAEFGAYLYDPRTRARTPIIDEKGIWDVMPRPLAARAAPPAIEDSAKNGISDQAVLIGSLNVYDSSVANIPAGSVVGVRVLEGFSVEEGIPDDFGLTEHEGSARLGEASVFADGSWAAMIPANVPVHLQAFDKFGMAISNEPVWFSGRPGESRFCGGCHESRSATTVIQPGITMAMATGKPERFDLPRAQRRSDDFSRANVKGVPWDKALQPILTAKCAGCHDGTPGAANKSLTFTDSMGNSQTIYFNLTGANADVNIGGEIISGYSASHLSLMGPMMMDLVEADITVTGDMEPQMIAGSARESLLFRKLNIRQLYGTGSERFRPGMPVHPADVGGQELTNDEAYLFVLAADAGGQFYSRENAPGTEY
jgi:hypothetical protein